MACSSWASQLYSKISAVFLSLSINHLTILNWLQVTKKLTPQKTPNPDDILDSVRLGQPLDQGGPDHQERVPIKDYPQTEPLPLFNQTPQRVPTMSGYTLTGPDIGPQTLLERSPAGPVHQPTVDHTPITPRPQAPQAHQSVSARAEPITEDMSPAPKAGGPRTRGRRQGAKGGGAKLAINFGGD